MQLCKSLLKFSNLVKLSFNSGRKVLSHFPKPKPLTTFALATSVTGFAYFKLFSDFKAHAQSGFHEVEAIDASEVPEGEMRLVKYGPKDTDTVMIYKFEGKFYATASKCPHANAPLEKGALFDDKVFCPWHGAAFSIVNGQTEQGPVFNDLPTYEVREENGKVYVKVPHEPVGSVQPHMAKRFKADFRKFVILGGGLAALSAAETLRQSGFGGEIIIVTNESDLPYDRTALSKNPFNTEIGKITIRDDDFFTKHDITVMKNSQVKYVNIDKSIVEIEGKDNIKFDKLLLATGARPRVPSVSGTGLKNVLTLRTYQDMQKIKEAAQQSKKIVIVGASFIGMEVAASLKKELGEKADVRVVDMAKTPFSRVLGDGVGEAIKALHEKNGVNFSLDKKLKSLEGAGTVNRIVLEDDTEIPADLVILGTGVKPNIDLVERSLRISDDGGVYTDVFMQSSVDDIFAAGDIASFPYWYTGNRVRIEHYNEAIQQGQTAAYNMMGKKVPHTSVPFFWSRQYDMSFRYVGHGGDFNKIHVDGNVNEMKFIAYYAKDNRIVAAATVGRDPASMIISQAMQANIMPTMEEIESGKVTVDDIKEKIKSKKGCGKCTKKACQERKPPMMSR